MPVWSPRPTKSDLDEHLEKAWRSLNHIVETNPSYEEATGVPLHQMMAHAKEAAESFENFHKDHTYDSQIEMYMQVYCLGFVVGAQFGELRYVNNHAPTD